MAKSTGGPAAVLAALLGIAGSRRSDEQDGCWPARPERPGSAGSDARRGCWPDPDDLRRGDSDPADAIRKITRRA